MTNSLDEPELSEEEERKESVRKFKYVFSSTTRVGISWELAVRLHDHYQSEPANAVGDYESYVSSQGDVKLDSKRIIDYMLSRNPGEE